MCKTGVNTLISGNIQHCILSEEMCVEIYARLDAVHVILCRGLTTDGRK